ncbi:phage head closure protein [Lactiplantibacillus plantarum]|uniref:phage head closure protein n=1 Tax=Lactiplantibacillus plantarum TaxID=1590 RepID=UPI0030A8BBEE
MAKKYDFSNLNNRAVFGVYEESGKENENTGQRDIVFVPKMTLWTELYKRTFFQNITIQGTDLKDSETLIVRHNRNVAGMQGVHFSGHEYRILNIYFGANTVNDYDLITIRERVEKHG